MSFRKSDLIADKISNLFSLFYGVTVLIIKKNMLMYVLTATLSECRKVIVMHISKKSVHDVLLTLSKQLKGGEEAAVIVSSSIRHQ